MINERRKYSIGHVYLVEQVESVARVRRRLEQCLECRWLLTNLEIDGIKLFWIFLVYNELRHSLDKCSMDLHVWCKRYTYNPRTTCGTPTTCITPNDTNKTHLELKISISFAQNHLFKWLKERSWLALSCDTFFIFFYRVTLSNY